MHGGEVESYPLSLLDEVFAIADCSILICLNSSTCNSWSETEGLTDNRYS